MPEETEQIASWCAALEIPAAARGGVSSSLLPCSARHPPLRRAEREGGEQDGAFLSLGTRTAVWAEGRDRGHAPPH